MEKTPQLTRHPASIPQNVSVKKCRSDATRNAAVRIQRLMAPTAPIQNHFLDTR